MCVDFAYTCKPYEDCLDFLPAQTRLLVFPTAALNRCDNKTLWYLVKQLIAYQKV
jgi:hypothetical protein